MVRVKIRIGGMTCAACSTSVERALGGMNGVLSVSVNLATNTASVDFDPDKVSLETISDEIESLGFDVLKDDGDDEGEIAHRTKINLIISALFTIPLLYIAMGPMVGLPVPGEIHDDPEVFSVVQLLLTVPVLIAGRDFYIRGYPNLVKLRPNMDTLVALGTSAAFIFSIYNTIQIFNGTGDPHSLYFESAATIVTLVMVGKYLESRSKYKTGESIRALMDLSPQEAHVIRDDEEIVVPISQLYVEDLAVIRPGERIPADGTITEGSTSIDESMLTGESVYADRSPGDRVFAGTMNMNGSIRMVVDSTGDDTVLSQIVRMVEDAQSSKAPVARLADRIAGIFVPVVMAIAIAACAAWMLAGKDVEFALTVLIAVLVIACPCSLGLATPLAIIVGTGKGTEYGILYKSAESLETSGKIDSVVLDKTGTVTSGRPEVSEIFSYMDEKRLVRIAASAESASEHPLGKAIVEYAQSSGITFETPTDFEAHTGNGLECTVSETKVHIGNVSFMNKMNIDTATSLTRIDELAVGGKTVIIVAADGEVAGLIALSDMIRETSARAVANLHEMNVRVTMITGDNPITAKAIAAKAGIENVVSEALPADKADGIKEMQECGMTVAMVGDGMNDAPALAQSNVGMAVGSGTDIAMGSADIVLMNDDLRSVPVAIEIGRRTMKHIRQNLFFAFLYNIIGIPVAAGILFIFGGPLLNPMIAAAAMSMSSVSVVLNSLRLRSFRPVSSV